MPAADLLRLVEAAYRQHYETPPARASVSFLGVEPIEVLRYQQPADDEQPSDLVSTGHRDEPVTTSYLSLGMSRYPMAEPAAVSVDPVTAPRAELLLSAAGRPDDVWQRLAVLAAAPAVESAVYRYGLRVDLGEPWCAGSRCTGAVLAEGPLRPIAIPGVSAVTVFRLLPATPVELAWARVHGSDALLERWRNARTDLRNLYRDAVRLE
jgi:Suppressor of fused protein (SUFU)